MKAELNKKKLIKGTDAVVPLTCKATGDYITGKMIDNQFYQIKSNGSYFKTPIEPKQGQVYEDIKTNKKYVWEDNSYVEFRDSKDGKDGKSAYQSYVDTTTDNPPKTEAEWVASLKGADGVSLGEVAIADDLNTNDARKVLSARQGYELGQKVNDVDDEPTAESEKFVKSGGVQNELALGAVYDVSAKNPTAGINNDGKWESLSTLLSDANLNNLIPTSVRKGGMSIKFVQSSDNNYVQYRLMADGWSVNTENWAIADEGVYVENPEFVYAMTDKDGKILWAIKTDGNFYFGAGCPQQVKEYLESKIVELKLTSVPEILTFLGDIEETTLADLLASKISVSDFEIGLALKVDKVEGKSLIDSDVAENVEFIENPEFIRATTDLEGKILEGITSEGKKKVMMETEVVGAEFSSIDDFEMVEMHLDNEDKIMYGVNKDGKFVADIKGLDELRNSIDRLSKDETYKTVIEYFANKPIYHPVDENGKELPTELSVLNVDRKAQQFRYTPMVFSSPVPMAADNQYYPAGNHIGIPYTSCMEIDKMVGFDLTILTFMTAVNNPFSMIYTENLRINKSVYGFTYHPEGRVGNIGGWAGVVCNIMENYATGMDIPYDTGMWAYLASIGEFTKIYLQEAQGLHIGDILWQSGHGRLVQTIWRGDNGLVEKVDVATGGSSGSEYLFQTPEAFDTDLANRNGIIYRNNKLYQNTNYKQNPFLTLAGETPIPFTYNDDICTFAGDYACFREGYRIVLNYNLKQDKAFESVELYKNDVLYGTYLLSSDTGSYDRGPDNFPAETAALVPSHSFDLSFLNLTYGKYKARLIGNGLTSDYTYFEILDTVVSHQVSNGKDVRINYSSHLGTPYYIRLSKKNGGPKCIYRLTNEDKEKGYCYFNFLDLIKKQYNNFSTDTYIKVYFKGDYGVVTNEPIKLL